MNCPWFLQIHGDELSSCGSLQDIHKLGSFSGKAVSELESIPLCLLTMLFFLSFACMQKALLAGNFYNYNSSCLVYERPFQGRQSLMMLLQNISNNRKLGWVEWHFPSELSRENCSMPLAHWVYLFECITRAFEQEGYG
jgi:hypothetical protein